MTAGSRDLLDTLRIGGSFNTIIGLVFLVIVIVSPDGLMGIWDRLWGLARTRWRPAKVRAVHGDPRRREGVKREEEWSQHRDRAYGRHQCFTFNRQPRRATGMSRFTRHWKLLLPLGVLVILASVVVSTSFAASKATVVKVAIMTDCKGGVRVRLRAGHRRRPGGVREVRARQGRRTRRSRPRA